MNVTIFAAMSANGVIGVSKTNDLPWPRIPEDMKRFREQTTGHAVVMGKNTYLSLPEAMRPLPNRVNVVISSELFGTPGVLTSGRFDTEVLDDLRVDLEARGVTELFVIGGQRLFAASLPLADTLDLTFVTKPYKGDVTFPWGSGFYSSLNPKYDSGTPDIDAYVNGQPYRFQRVMRRVSETSPLVFTQWKRKAL